MASPSGFATHSRPVLEDLFDEGFRLSIGRRRHAGRKLFRIRSAVRRGSARHQRQEADGRGRQDSDNVRLGPSLDEQEQDEEGRHGEHEAVRVFLGEYPGDIDPRNSTPRRTEPQLSGKSLAFLSRRTAPPRPNEHTSARAVLNLMDGGYTKAYALKGGWYEWFQAKYPVEKR